MFVTKVAGLEELGEGLGAGVGLFGAGKGLVVFDCLVGSAETEGVGKEGESSEDAGGGEHECLQLGEVGSEVDEVGVDRGASPALFEDDQDGHYPDEFLFLYFSELA